MNKKAGNDIDVFNITEVGLTAFEVATSYSQPTPLAQFRLDATPKPNRGNLRHLSEFELILELSCQGFSFEYQKNIRKLEPYRAGGERKWFYHTATLKGGINYKYLSVLAVADDLFTDGLRMIHHGQPVSYYDTLLKMDSSRLNEVLPSKSKAFYRELLQQQSSRTAPSKGKQRPAMMVDDDEQVSLLAPPVLPLPQKDHAPANTNAPKISHANVNAKKKRSLSRSRSSSDSDSSLGSGSEPDSVHMSVNEPEHNDGSSSVIDAPQPHDQGPMSHTSDEAIGAINGSSSTCSQVAVATGLSRPRGDSDKIAVASASGISALVEFGTTNEVPVPVDSPKTDASVPAPVESCVDRFDPGSESGPGPGPPKKKESKTSKTMTKNKTSEPSGSSELPEKASSAHPQRAPVAVDRGLPKSGASASFWNPSTVWVGDLPFIERTDQKVGDQRAENKSR